MATYVILSRLDAGAVKDPGEFRKLADSVTQRIREQCPRVKWKDSYALMGRFDIIDIVESDSPAEVERAAMIIRSYGHARTETLHATPWKEFITAL